MGTAPAAPAGRGRAAGTYRRSGGGFGGRPPRRTGFAGPGRALPRAEGLREGGRLRTDGGGPAGRPAPVGYGVTGLRATPST
ncbi:hypothetical protein GCM10009802_35590 [Streptomyces synnematoformans]|uniref:Uncharacterized protein n=1 Tax=Streptomyces synnematoformans TaxID=415721 RepID=A0ABN2YJL8_9ACTN